MFVPRVVKSMIADLPHRKAPLFGLSVLAVLREKRPEVASFLLVLGFCERSDSGVAVVAGPLVVDKREQVPGFPYTLGMAGMPCSSLLGDLSKAIETCLIRHRNRPARGAPGELQMAIMMPASDQAVLDRHETIVAALRAIV